MPIVTTGQITIVDQNDAKPITALISASGPIQQVYSKNNGIEAFFPNWSTTPITLTASVFVGGVNVAADTACSGRVWSFTFNGAQIGTDAATITRNTNLTTAAPSVTYFFRCTYTDPVTQIASRVDARIDLGLVQTGSNAVYVLVTGGEAIKKVTAGSTGARTAVKAELVRSSGFDTDNLQYRWYSIAADGTKRKLHSAEANVVAGRYAVASTPANAAPNPSLPTLGPSTFTGAVITNSLTGTANADWCTGGSPGFNTLVISESAVAGLQVYQVEVRDTSEGAEADRPVYTAYFTIKDVSDPISIEVLSDNGDRLLNGQGSTRLQVKVYSGQTEISSYAGWTFNWYMRNKNGQRIGFVALPAAPSAVPISTRAITTNTAGAITIPVAETYATDELLKVVSASGNDVAFVQAVGGAVAANGNITLDTTLTTANSEAGAVTALTAGMFNGGTVYKAVPMKVTTGSVDGKLGPVITMQDIDGKNTITVDADKPVAV